ncbi:hypothetical protein [Clostridium sp. BL-8]|uniref:hypothetical protein n=1 Tax=Clostridium sp. BL-8 TaxID=349938 RepID=UPI00098C1AB9|nr:hypothetical protein [Clostridium sp. BL-8]OOM78812.1 hypothetical protein CLOBL_20600 [Clostridium sp. BL-8]
MDIDVIWDKLYERKLNWAYKGREDFYKTIKDKDIMEVYKNSDQEINVCVYGRSQVGKTTLILKLIGIKEEYIQKVGDILRGGRPKGNSATIVATIYSMSNDNYFYYQETGGNVLRYTEEEIIKQLAELREKAYIGVAALDRVKISIPKKFFEEKIEERNINIIDLPGIESADEREYNHVAKIVKKFVPISNMIILIERADQVAYLGKLKLPGIDYWYEEMERFKLVLTRSVSNRSTQKELREIIDIDKEKYVRLFESDICKDANMIELKNNIVFPLEYGESWDELKKSDKDLTTKIIPILDELYDQLLQDIVESQNPYNQFIMSMKMHNRINKVIQRKIDVFTDEINLLENDMVEKHEILGKRRAVLNQCNCILQEKEEQLDKLKEIEAIEKIKFDSIEYSFTKYASSLKGYVEEEISIIVEKANNLIKELDNENIIIKNQTNSIAYKEAACYLKRLDDYIIDIYFIDSNFYEDKNQAEKTVSKIKEKVSEYLEDQIKNYVAKEKKEILKQITNMQSKKRVIDKVCIDSTKEIEVNEKEICKKKKDLDIFKIKSEEDRKTTENFTKSIYSSYHDEMNAISRNINDNKTPVEIKILNLFYMYLISDELSKLEGLLG